MKIPDLAPSSFDMARLMDEVPQEVQEMMQAFLRCRDPEMATHVANALTSAAGMIRAVGERAREEKTETLYRGERA